MVQILPTEYSPFSQLGSNIGQGFSQSFLGALNQLNQQKQTEARTSRLNDLLADISPENAKDPLEIVKRLGAEFPDLAKSLISLQTQQSKGQGGYFSEEEFNDTLEKLNFPEEKKNAYRNLYKNSTTGGRTAITKALLDDIERSQVSPSEGFNIQEKIKITEKEPSPEIAEIDEERFTYPKLNTFKDLTRTQKQARENQLRKENTPIYKATVDKLKNNKQERFSINKLEKLNDTGKLPKNLEKLLNVNLSSGELRLAGAANPETQEYVKIINDFTTKAKDSFGARVTNFELDRFMQRLPTLLNSDEGRRAIFQYMKTINDLNKIYDESLKDVYNHYKISNLTSQDAEDIAEKLRGNKVDLLLEDALESEAKAQTIYDFNEKKQEGETLMFFNGEYIYVPNDEVKKAIKAGALEL